MMRQVDGRENKCITMEGETDDGDGVYTGDDRVVVG